MQAFGNWSFNESLCVIGIPEKRTEDLREDP